jgi:hypothetical protein
MPIDVANTFEKAIPVLCVQGARTAVDYYVTALGGARIRRPPTNYPWAFEMQVEDLDGNVLRFGSDSIPGESYGEWLDMHGRLWPFSPAADPGE